ncbi:hypothetical protein BT69DRAFT_1338656 [Atractiella rhizophila]|nr:hypothetical protein BT69DRAFT_1338656 [Atractiella rhizophila]
MASTIRLSLLLALVALGIPLWSLYVSPLLHLTGYFRTPSFHNSDSCLRFPIPHVHQLTLHRASGNVFAVRDKDVKMWKVEEGVLRDVELDWGQGVNGGEKEMLAVELLDLEEVEEGGQGLRAYTVVKKHGQYWVEIYGTTKEKMEHWTFSEGHAYSQLRDLIPTSILPISTDAFYISAVSSGLPSFLQSQLNEGPEDSIYVLTDQAVTSYTVQSDGALSLQDAQRIPRHLTTTTVAPSGSVYITSHPFPTLKSDGGVEVWRLSNETGEDSTYRRMDTVERFYGGRLKMETVFAHKERAETLVVKGNKFILAGRENEWTEVCTLPDDMEA